MRCLLILTLAKRQWSWNGAALDQFSLRLVASFSLAQPNFGHYKVKVEKESFFFHRKKCKFQVPNCHPVGWRRIGEEEVRLSHLSCWQFRCYLSYPSKNIIFFYKTGEIKLKTRKPEGEKLIKRVFLFK